MAVNLSPVGGVAAQFFTNTGAVLTGGKLYTYLAGTTTPATTYTSSQGITAWTNPIVLDAAGRVSGSGEIWLTDGINYKFVLKDSNDVLIATYDNVSGINSNFLAFVNQQEIITATAGQTVFNLSITYQPGTNSLSVFVDGVNQYGPGAQYAYTETDSDTVTFVSGLHVGAVVKFTTTQQQSAGAVDSSQVTYDPPFTGSVATNVEAKLSEYVSVADFGAVGDGTTNDTAAIQAAFAASNNVYFPAGNYRCTSTITISNVKGLTITGAGASLVNTGDLFSGNTIINFDGAASGSNGFVITGCVGVKLNNFVIRQKRSGTGGGAALYINTGHMFSVDSVFVDSDVGLTGCGFLFGGGGGASSFFTGSVTDCKAITNGEPAFKSDVTNTSQTFESCYAINGPWVLNGLAYCALISCAADSAPNYSYYIDNCSAVSIISCGAEASGDGAFYVRNNSSNITFISPAGIANNTNNVITDGDLIFIDSTVNPCIAIEIHNPTSLAPANVCSSNIRATANTGLVDVYGVSSARLPEGISGDSTWYLTKLSQYGDFELASFTATLNANWTIVGGVPTITSKFIKKGKLIWFNININPVTSIKANADARINMPWASYAASPVLMIDGALVSYDNPLYFGGTIFVPVTGTITDDLVISGSFSIG
jgi:hypothetical protein